MIGAKKKSQNFSGLVRKLEADINDRFPNISNKIQSINVDSSPISGAVRSAGVFINVDIWYYNSGWYLFGATIGRNCRR